MMKTDDGTAYEIYAPDNAPEDHGSVDTLILVHGLGLSMRTWDDFIPALRRRYQVVIYDLCGHGHSDLPQKTPSLSVLSDQLDALLISLGIDRAHIIGFSLGGMINRRFAMDHREKVASLAILNSPHERDAKSQKLVEQRAKDTSNGGAAATIDVTLERWFTPSFRASHPARVAWVRQTVLANNPENYAAHRFVLANGVIELIRPTPAITAPSLVITCARDSGSTPLMSEAITNEIDGAELVIIPDLQHLGLLEQPDLFLAPLLRFLDDLTRIPHER